MRVSMTSKGDLKKTKRFLNSLSRKEHLQVLNECGRLGVEALAEATPKDSGLTASSWTYEIKSSDGETSITWLNTNLANGWFPVALMLQYGHGTGTGGYVQGIDYINPAIKPVFDNIAEIVWKVVKGL